MTRAIHADVITELAKDDFTMVSLIELRFSSVIYMCSGGYQITYDGNTYTPSGHVAKISDVSESAKLAVGAVRLELSAAEQTYVAQFLNNDWMDIQIVYYKALLDSSAAIIGTPLMFFDGNITGFSITDRGKTSSMSIKAASHWANFEVVSGRKTNDTSQQALFPGDLGMEYASHTVRDIKWGK